MPFIQLERSMTPITDQVRAFLKDVDFSGVSDEPELTVQEQTEFRSQACFLYGADHSAFPLCFHFPDLLPPTLLQKLYDLQVPAAPQEPDKLVEETAAEAEVLAVEQVPTRRKPR